MGRKVYTNLYLTLLFSSNNLKLQTTKSSFFNIGWKIYLSFNILLLPKKSVFKLKVFLKFGGAFLQKHY